MPGAVHVPRGYLEFQVEGRIPDKSAPIVVYCAGGSRSAFAARTLGEMGYTDVVSLTGGFNKLEGRGPSLDGARTLDPGTAEPLPTAPPAPRGRGGRDSQAARCQGSPPRSRRARLAGRSLPGRRRGGDDRDHRHGRGRRLQPPASDPPQHGPDRRPEGGLGQEDPDGPQPRCRRRHLRRPARGRQHPRHHRRLRRHRRRDRQFPDPLSGERRRPAQADPRGPRIDLPVRGPGHGFDPYVGPCYRCLIPEPPRPNSRRRVPKPGCSACCPGSSAPSRPSRPSRCC